jgi:hypothetical protein
MIDIFYIGERRFSDRTEKNHDLFFSEISKICDFEIHDFTKEIGSQRKECPYTTSGMIQLWEFLHFSENLNAPTLIRMRTDIWLCESAIEVAIEEIKNIRENIHDVSFLGWEKADHIFKEKKYKRLSEKKVPDFLIIANKSVISKKEDVLHTIEKEEKGGIKAYPLITNSKRIYSVGCQIHILRHGEEFEHESSIAHDFCKRKNKYSHAADYFEKIKGKL